MVGQGEFWGRDKEVIRSWLFSRHGGSQEYPNLNIFSNMHPRNLINRYQQLQFLKGTSLFQGPSFWGPPAISFRECVDIYI